MKFALARFTPVLMGSSTLLCSIGLAQTTVPVSVGPGGVLGNHASSHPSMSADGRYVAFESVASNLVPGDTNAASDVFVFDLQSGAVSRASVDSSGAQGDGSSYSASISGDGRFIAFYSGASNLVPGDSNRIFDVFVHDRVSGVTTRVSVDSGGGESDGACYYPSISSDGRYVAFRSNATNLVPGDTNGVDDIFVHDLQTGATTRVSVDSSAAQSNAASDHPSISGDGRVVAFDSHATNLVPGDTNGWADIFVHDMSSGATTRVSVDAAGLQSNHQSSFPSISRDGRYVACDSYANNLVPFDTNGAADVFVYDREGGRVRRVSVDSAGAQGAGVSAFPSISFEGRYVAFASTADNLAPGDHNEHYDVFVHDLLTGSTTQMSVDPAGFSANDISTSPSISADGRYVAFASPSNNLALGDTNGTSDVFVHDRGAASSFTALCSGDGARDACPCANNGVAGHGCDNSVATGGAILTSSGGASLSADTAQLTSSGELPNALSILLQGDAASTPSLFGDGLRCASGTLLRLSMKHAMGGTVTCPQAGDPSLASQSVMLGHPIPLGATRIYQFYYRDPNLGFCPGGFNASNAIAIAWGS
jgi:Tol biopolymer transport system component